MRCAPSCRCQFGSPQRAPPPRCLAPPLPGAGLFVEQGPEVHERQMRVNYLGTVHTVQVGGGLLPGQGFGGRRTPAACCPAPACSAGLAVCAAGALRCCSPRSSPPGAPRFPAAWPQAALPGMLERRQGRIVLVASTLAVLGFAGALRQRGGLGGDAWTGWVACCALLVGCCCAYGCKPMIPKQCPSRGTQPHAATPAPACAGYSSYAPSKWAVRGLADCLHNELQGTGVGVSVAYPPDTGEKGSRGWGASSRSRSLQRGTLTALCKRGASPDALLAQANWGPTPASAGPCIQRVCVRAHATTPAACPLSLAPQTPPATPLRWRASRRCARQ